jgi:hypothetical protein
MELSFDFQYNDSSNAMVCLPCSDYGFTQRQDGYFFWSNTCVRDNSSDVDVHAIPSPCPEGTFYKRTKGYRRVVGDTCDGGVEHLLEPDNMACPVKGNSVFSKHTRILVVVQ